MFPGTEVISDPGKVSFKWAAIKRTRQTRWLIFKGNALNNPTYRPHEHHMREDDIEYNGAKDVQKG